MASQITARRLVQIRGDLASTKAGGLCGARTAGGSRCALVQGHKGVRHLAIGLDVCGFFIDGGVVQEPRVERALLDAARVALTDYAIGAGFDDLAERIAIGGPGRERAALVWCDSIVLPPASPCFAVLVDPSVWIAAFRARSPLPASRILERERERIAKAHERVRSALRGRCLVCNSKPARPRRPTCSGCASGAAARNARKRATVSSVMRKSLSAET